MVGLLSDSVILLVRHELHAPLSNETERMGKGLLLETGGGTETLVVTAMTGVAGGTVAESCRHLTIGYIISRDVVLTDRTTRNTRLHLAQVGVDCWVTLGEINSARVC